MARHVPFIDVRLRDGNDEFAPVNFVASRKKSRDPRLSDEDKRLSGVKDASGCPDRATLSRRDVSLPAKLNMSHFSNPYLYLARRDPRRRFRRHTVTVTADAAAEYDDEEDVDVVLPRRLVPDEIASRGRKFSQDIRLPSRL